MILDRNGKLYQPLTKLSWGCRGEPDRRYIMTADENNRVELYQCSASAPKITWKNFACTVQKKLLEGFKISFQIFLPVPKPLIGTMKQNPEDS